jgi:hypothetical protein
MLIRIYIQFVMKGKLDSNFLLILIRMFIELKRRYFV